MSEISERVLDVRVVNDGGSAGRVEFELSGGRIASIPASIEVGTGGFAPEETAFRGPRANVDKPNQPRTESGQAETEGALLSDGEGGQTAAEDSAPSSTEPAEPEPEPAQPKGKLPDDFPGHAALDAFGIHTYGQLRKALADEVKIPGIGDATKTKIEEALAASTEE
jgi:hypothetical protein